MALKRTTREGEFEDITTMANCLMLLSSTTTAQVSEDSSLYANRVFECKTCNRQFPSFQALGGHRASHKKPRLTADQLAASALPPKPKTHECSICGLEFAIGQALGGHMRRHKAALNDQKQKQQQQQQQQKQISQMPMPFLSMSLSQAPVLKRSNSSRRVLSLDLNLTPSENNFIFGKINSPVVHCFI